MAESVIPVDLTNPGQVFACLGVMEAADVLLGDAAASFDWERGRDVEFRLSCAGSEPPCERTMRFLEEAKVVATVPAQSKNSIKWKQAWGDSPEIVDPSDSPYPFPDPDTPATLAVVLRDKDGREIPVDYWGDATKRDNVKFWAGAAGYPGAAIIRDALRLVRGTMLRHSTDPFQVERPQTNSFRFDWRRDYIPIQEGFSPNRHSRMAMVGFPIVEILAAIGMTNARPRRRKKLEYRYGVLGYDGKSLLDPVFHRAALGAEASPVPGRLFRRFVMHLDWPGQEHKARCITQVFEEE